VCAQELQGLGSTREQLASWAPPDIALGFQIVRPMTMAEAPPQATVLRPARWWSRSIPAWAQAAAVLAIFAGGFFAGGWRRPAVYAPGADAPVVASAPPSAPQAVSAPSGQATASQVAELTREVQRLRAEVEAFSSSAAPASTSRALTGSEADLLARVRAMIADSEAGLRTDMSLQTTQMARDIELQRRADLERFNRELTQVNTEAGQALRRTQQDIQGLYFKMVGQSAPPQGR
jgi:hypothetical protein